MPKYCLVAMTPMGTYTSKIEEFTEAQAEEISDVIMGAHLSTLKIEMPGGDFVILRDRVFSESIIRIERQRDLED